MTQNTRITRQGIQYISGFAGVDKHYDNKNNKKYSRIFKNKAKINYDVRPAN